VHYASVFYRKGLILIADNRYAANNNSSKNENNQSKELVNENIRFPEVLLIGPNGEQLGVMSSREAQFKANDYDLDLMCVAPNAKPPVCKIINYSKYRFEQQKKAKEAKKNQHTVEVKEVQLTPQIGGHDMETKARAATKFLEAGNKVKVGVRFRGRQMTHIEVGQEVMDKFIDLLKDYANIEKPANMEGRWMYAILAPKKK
jgi:translation initiation factor IF-3